MQRLWDHLVDNIKCVPKVERPQRLTGQWLELFAHMIFTHKRGEPIHRISGFDQIKDTFNIVLARKQSFNIPITDTGIGMCAILGKANPARALVALLESCAVSMDIMTAMIDYDYIDTVVYPHGFYDDEAAHRRFDELRPFSNLL
jgi:hypothetical protein